MTDKVVLVTGGSRGIGAAIAKRLAAEGAKVVITYARDAEAAERTVAAIRAEGAAAAAIKAEAANLSDAANAVDFTVSTFGRLDVLVNNAGTVVAKPFAETSLKEVSHVLDVNLRSVLAVTHAALRHLPDGGRIISIGSCAGENVGEPGLVTYAATKGALRLFSQGSGP